MHHITARIYYEDTDAGGVVYYANYLKFAERARTEMLRQLGIHQRKLWDERQIGFVVRRAELDLLAPARLDDEITIHSQIEEVKPASLRLLQTMKRKEQLLCTLRVKIACINTHIKPSRLPKDLLEIFSKSLYEK